MLLLRFSSFCHSFNSTLKNVLTEYVPYLSIKRFDSSWVRMYLGDMKSAGISYTVDHDNNVANLKIPPPSEWGRWKAGSVLEVRSVLEFLFGCRLYALYSLSEDNKIPFLEIENLFENSSSIMKSYQLNIIKELPKMNKYPDLSVRLKVSSIGRSSVTFISELIDNDSNVYYVNTHCAGFIDKSNRKRLDIPVWWQEKYEPKEVHKVDIPSLIKPSYCLQYNAFVTYDDTDINNHTNYMSLLTFCQQALEIASNTSMFDYLSDIKLNYQKISVFYLKETLLGDVLSITIWPDDINEYEINFHIEHGDELVCQMIFNFLPPSKL